MHCATMKTLNEDFRLPRYEVEDTCSLLGYDTVRGGNFLPTFQDNLSVPTLGVQSQDF